MQTIFSRSPWERASVVPLRGPMMGQMAPGCEPTPEGGYRCPDGTYHPPGCPMGSPQTIQGQPGPTATPFPILPVALVAAAGAVGYALLSGRQLSAEAIPAEVVARLEDITTSIRAERAADAWNFSQYLAKGKENLDLLEKERLADLELARQNRIWETNHMNADGLQAAQTALDSIQAQRGAIKASAEEYRARVDANSQNVVNLRQKALELIDTLPPEVQDEARKKIDPCYKNAVMKGPFLGQVRMGQSWNDAGIRNQGGFYSWNGYGQSPEQRILQNAQEQMNAPVSLNPEQRLLQANAAAQCYTCVNDDGTIKAGVDSGTAESLRKQGYRCKKDECAQQSGYGAGTYSSFNGYGDLMTSSTPAASMVTDMNPSMTSYGGMMGRRYPVVNR